MPSTITAAQSWRMSLAGAKMYHFTLSEFSVDNARTKVFAGGLHSFKFQWENGTIFGRALCTGKGYATRLTRLSPLP